MSEKAINVWRREFEETANRKGLSIAQQPGMRQDAKSRPVSVDFEQLDELAARRGVDVAGGLMRSAFVLIHEGAFTDSDLHNFDAYVLPSTMQSGDKLYAPVIYINPRTIAADPTLRRVNHNLRHEVSHLGDDVLVAPYNNPEIIAKHKLRRMLFGVEAVRAHLWRKSPSERYAEGFARQNSDINPITFQGEG